MQTSKRKTRRRNTSRTKTLRKTKMKTETRPATRGNANQQPPAANRHTKEVFKHRPTHHGIGRKGARAAKTKYYLEEEARYERQTEGGDFVLSRRSVPLRLSGPHARNFGPMFKYLHT